MTALAFIDFETVVGDRGSTEFYRRDFRVTSMAVTILDTATGAIRSSFYEGEDACRNQLIALINSEHEFEFVAHNMQFELGVVRCRFPELYDLMIWHADTMRLVQQYDNGGDKFAVEMPLSLDDQLDAALNISDDGDTKPKKKKKNKPKTIAGLGLKVAVRRILKEPLSHKEEAHEWLRSNVEGCRSGNEGSFLNKLPPELLRRYNIGDTESSVRLYQFITREFTRIGFDWRFDHELFLRSVRQIVDAKIRGVPVDREGLNAYRLVVEAEIETIRKTFKDRFTNEIAAVERGRLLDAVRKRKTLRGRKSFVRRYRMGIDTAVADVRFNPGSNKQLAALFVGELGLPVKFTTNKGAPSFKSALLGQWGDGGEILKAQRRRLLVFKQVEALLALTAYDGRWHQDLKACGTATSRYSGGEHGS